MSKILSISILLTLCTLSSFGQLDDGSFAPNFTATDIEGNSWTLYDILDQNKSVILDISATWCGPCWTYHESGVLDELYEQYGPNGTDELVVLLIEGSPDTNIDCLYNNADCNFSQTFGDWVSGTEYPIIDYDNITNLFKTNFFPTLLFICQDRKLTSMFTPSVEEIYSNHSNCDQPIGTNNISIISYLGSSENNCNSGTLTPGVLIQNSGTAVIESATFELYIDGSLTQSIEWVGNLNSFQSEEIYFSSFDVATDINIEISTKIVNQVSDDTPSDNTITSVAYGTFNTNDNFISLVLNFEDPGDAFECYWELVNEDGQILYKGGNLLNVNQEFDPSSLYESGNPITIELALPKDGCYEMNLYEFFGDGFGSTEYKFIDASNQIIMEGPSFDATQAIDVQYLNLNDGVDVIDNASIIGYSGEEGFVCSNHSYVPTLNIQNIGSNPISSMLIELTDDTGLVYNQDWSGVISAGESRVIQLNEVIISDNTIINYTLKEINGNLDGHGYNNTISAIFETKTTSAPLVNLEIQLDFNGEENEWIFRNSLGEVLASGSNHQSEELIKVALDLSLGQDECYEVVLTDLAGDGFSTFAQGVQQAYFKLYDESNNIIIERQLRNVPFSELVFGFDGKLSTSSSDIYDLSEIFLFPNPAKENLFIGFTKSQNISSFSIYNSIGELVKSVTPKTKSRLSYSIGTENLSNGLYFLIAENEAARIIQQFAIVH